MLACLVYAEHKCRHTIYFDIVAQFLLGISSNATYQYQSESDNYSIHIISVISLIMFGMATILTIRIEDTLLNIFEAEASTPRTFVLVASK